MDLISSIKIERLLELSLQYGSKLGGALAILILGLWFAKKIKKISYLAITRAKIDETLAKFLSTALKWVIVSTVCISILGMFGIETASFAALIAASGLAIGLAFQGTLSNVASGVMLLIFRPFEVGQFIKVSGVSGIVDEIGLFTTTIDTPDRRRIIVPNSNVFGSTLENVSHHDQRRVDISIGTAYDADINTTRLILKNVLENNESVLQDPAPATILVGLGASSVDWSLRGWVQAKDYWAVKEQLLVETKIQLDANGIGIPFPQVDVHMQGLPLFSGSPSKGIDEQRTSLQ